MFSDTVKSDSCLSWTEKEYSEVQEYLGHPTNGRAHRLYWCKNCGVPLLTPICYQCHSRGRQFIMDAKPVFAEEHALLEEICGHSLPDSLYFSRGRLYYGGQFLMSFTVQDGHIVVNKSSADLLIDETACTERTTSLELCVAANRPALGFLEQRAMDSILDVVQQHPDRKPVVSFSGGKDSAVVAHLVTRAVKGIAEVSLFFADTTLEHPETYDYVRQFAEYYGLPLIVERADCDFLQMCEQLEPPSRIMRWCCTVFKANPLNTFLRNHEGVLSFDGIRSTESNRRRNYPRIDGNKKALRQLVFRPILDWSSLAVWLYIFAYHIPYNPAYDKGYARVGCVICPFSTAFNDFLTRRYYPDKVKQWEALLERYFQTHYTDRFDQEVARIWFEQGLWKERKPHHKNDLAITRASTCPSLQEYVYLLDSPIGLQFLEYLKPLGELTFTIESGFFRLVSENGLFVSGMLEDNVLTVSFTGPDSERSLLYLERQVKKAANCVKCGACVGTCPQHAIEVQAGKAFLVQERACTHCLSCVKSNFTNYGCVALSYKRNKKSIGGENSGDKKPL